MPITNSCQSCKRNVTRVHFPGLSCVGCNRYWHFQCADLSEKASKDLTENNFSWTCKNCKRRSNILPGPSPNKSIVVVSSQNTSTQPSSSTAKNQKSSSKASETKPSASASTTKQLADACDRITKLEDLLSAALKRIDSLEVQAGEKEQIAEGLSIKVNNLETATNLIGKHLNDDILEIQGLPDSALENPLSSTIAVSEAIGCIITEEDLACSPTRDSNKVRITFKSKGTRRNFLLAGKQFNRSKRKLPLNQQSHRIHVNEILSDSQKKLYRETKTFALTNNFKFVWVGLSGHIFIKKGEGHQPITITSSLSLDNINNAAVLPELQGAANQIN